MNNNLETGFWDREYPSEKEIETLNNSFIENNQYSSNSFDNIEEELEDLYENVEEENNEISVIKKAQTRLEQGRLYEMLIKHDLFENVDALPEAVDNVQKEIKTFIMERLEVLLGMRSEKEKEQVVSYSQFNDIEVEALKQVAARLTKGSSGNVVKKQPSNELNTVKKQTKEIKINTVGKKTVLNNKKQTNKQVSRQVSKQTEPKVVAKKPILKNKSVEQVVKEDMQYVESLKGKSLEEANAIVSQRHSRPTPKVNVNQESINNYYTTKVAMQDSKLSDFGKLMKMAALKKAQE